VDGAGGQGDPGEQVRREKAPPRELRRGHQALRLELELVGGHCSLLGNVHRSPNLAESARHRQSAIARRSEPGRESRGRRGCASRDHALRCRAMKITSVQATWVHVPIPYERQHVSVFGRVGSFDSVLVKIETDSGLVGWGEAKAGVGSASSAHGLAAIVNRDYAPLLVGQDPRDVSRLWDVMYNTPREGYALDRGHVLPQLGRRGLSISAIAGVDLALWDLLGKSLGAPVWRLLGGRRAERMPAYASGGWADEAHIGEQLQGYIDKGGFRAVKMRVGVMDGEPRASAARVR